MSDLAALLHTTPSSTLFATPFTAPVPAPPPVQDPEEKEGEETEPKGGPEASRTIFIGNVPLETHKRMLKADFSKYGEIEKVWRRSVPVDRGKLSIAVACIRRKYQEDAQTCNYYILFTTREGASKALEANGSVYNEKRIRVDWAEGAKVRSRQEVDPSLSVFVGNLPFTVREEDLWEEFKDFGTLQYVRVIRDKNTHQGKGFAYVCYSSKQSARMALSKHLSLFQVDSTQGRQLRVFPCKKQVQMNVMRRMKGRDVQGKKMRWKQQSQEEGPQDLESREEEEEMEGFEDMPSPGRKKRKRDRDAPEPAWKQMKKEQKKLKAKMQAKKAVSKKAK